MVDLSPPGQIVFRSHCPEMWTQVFDNLKDDLCDLVNAANSCVLFEDLLLEKIDALRAEDVVPLLLKWLDCGDVVNCRRISKRIQSSVDNVLDNREGFCEFKNTNLVPMRQLPLPRRAPPSLEYDHFASIRFKRTILDSIAKVEKIREERKPSLEYESGRPFIGQNLMLYQQREPGTNVTVFFDMDLLNRSIQLMEEFQTKLTHLTLLLKDIDTNIIGMYDIYVRVFTALPLLQTFSGLQIKDRWDVDFDELEAHIALNPLPPMASLKQLSFWHSELPTPTYQEIATKYSGQLEVLEFDLGRGVPDFLANAQQQFPTLVKLEVCLNLDVQELLLNMRADNLVSLSLRLCRGFFTFLAPADFILIFRSFPNMTLLKFTILTLDPSETWPAFADEALFKEVRNQNPKLKKLELKSSYHCLHYPLRCFIHLFPNVESLNVEVNCHLGTNSQPDLDLDLLKRGRLYESSLWEEAASLERVDSAHGINPEVRSTFTRDAYNQFKETQLQQSGCSIV